MESIIESMGSYEVSFDKDFIFGIDVGYRNGNGNGCGRGSGHGYGDVTGCAAVIGDFGFSSYGSGEGSGCGLDKIRGSSHV